MEKRKWKENPKYKDDDLLSRIAEIMGDIPIQPRADYDVCVRAGDVPLRQAEFFKITDLSISPSRIISGDEIFEEEKEILKKNVKGALSKFRQSRLENLSKLYSPDEAVQRALDEMTFEGDLPDILAEAKERLADMGFSDEQVKSVCFMPKEKALKFASDDLGKFLKPVLSDFDALFGKLTSLNPAERRKALNTVLRAWEEAAEEWEREEKEQLKDMKPGLLARLSQSDISFSQQMGNIANSSFHAVTDFDTALGAIVVSGMFPPAALMYALPILVPALLDLFYSNLSVERKEKSKDQQALITEEMSRLFASKATGNALVSELALRLANGESPERVWEDMPKITAKLRNMFDALHGTGKKVFAEHSHNDVITPQSSEHLQMADELREAAKVAVESFWDERKEKAAVMIEESARVEAEIANSIKLSFDEEGVSFYFEKMPEDAFSKLKLENAEKAVKEYVDHINKIMKPDNANVQFFLQHFGILPLPMRIAAVFADDYGIFGGRVGRQAGTSMVETKMILNAIKNIDLKSPQQLKARGFLAADAVVRLLPQELLGMISERVKEVDHSKIYYPDGMEHFLNVMAPLENAIAQVEREATDMSEKTKKTIGLLLYFGAGEYDYYAHTTMCQLLGTDDIGQINKAAVQFLGEFTKMSDAEINEIATELYSLFNRTVTEPGIAETIKKHEMPFDDVEEEVEMGR